MEMKKGISSELLVVPIAIAIGFFLSLVLGLSNSRVYADPPAHVFEPPSLQYFLSNADRFESGVKIRLSGYIYDTAEYLGLTTEKNKLRLFPEPESEWKSQRFVLVLIPKYYLPERGRQILIEGTLWRIGKKICIDVERII
jgi:hypothetical protein